MIYISVRDKILKLLIFILLIGCSNYNKDFKKLKIQKKLKTYSLVELDKNKILKLKENTTTFSPFYLIVLSESNKIKNIEYVPIIKTSHQPIVFNENYYIETGCKKEKEGFQNYFVVYSNSKNNFRHYDYENKVYEMIVIDNYLFYNKGKSGNGLYRIDLFKGTKKIFNITSFGSFYKIDNDYYYQFINPNSGLSETYLIQKGEIVKKNLVINDDNRILLIKQYNKEKLGIYSEILGLRRTKP